MSAHVNHDLEYYAKCMLGGWFACALTHSGIAPLDIVKCRRQVNPNFSKSLVSGVFKLAKEGLGGRGLYLGWKPALIGYGFQGLGKFGFYEVFKDVFKKLVGPENATKYRQIGWSVASASAEVIADILLCPWEAIKVRVQTAQPGQFPWQFGKATSLMYKERGIGGLYLGIAPLWVRQIPYTIVKFVAFEQFVEMIYKYICTKPRNEYSKAQQLGVTFSAGYAAGVFCAIVSHPADTLVSKLYGSKSQGTMWENTQKIYKDIGFIGLWRGLITRIIMIGTLTGLQWWIYDTWKTTMGLGTTGGEATQKKH